jgi:hypothetical protein
MEDLLPIVDQFAIPGKISGISPLGSGHIHETYYVKTKSARTDNYVIQLFNIHVFRNPEAVMHNISLVTDHIRKKLEAAGTPDINRRVLRPVGLKNGEWMYFDASGRVWRGSSGRLVTETM